MKQATDIKVIRNTDEYVDKGFDSVQKITIDLTTALSITKEELGILVDTALPYFNDEQLRNLSDKIHRLINA